MPIVFPGDQFGEPSRQYNGAGMVGGVEKYGSVNGDTISVTNLNASNITSGTISADRIAANTITSDMIQANAITSGKIDTYAVTSGKIAADSITATEIASDTITANEIASGTITASEIASNAITADKIQANAVTSSKINVGTLSAITADMGTITGGKLNLGASSSAPLYVWGSYFEGGGWGTNGKLQMGDNISMNSHNIDGCSQLYVGTVNAGPINGTSLAISGSKSAIIDTINYGKRLVYSAEGPEVWLYDFVDEMNDDALDPIFLEMTEGDTYYIKASMQNGGTKYQAWRIRKGYLNIRAELVSDEESK